MAKPCSFSAAVMLAAAVAFPVAGCRRETARRPGEGPGTSSASDADALHSQAADHDFDLAGLDERTGEDLEFGTLEDDPLAVDPLEEPRQSPKGRVWLYDGFLEGEAMPVAGINADPVRADEDPMVTAADGSFRCVYPQSAVDDQEIRLGPVRLADGGSQYVMRTRGGVFFGASRLLMEGPLPEDTKAAHAEVTRRRDALIAWKGDKLLQERRFRKDGHRVLEFTFSRTRPHDGQKQIVSVCVHFAGEYGYMLMVKAPKESFDKAWAREFFDSIELLPNEQPE